MNFTVEERLLLLHILPKQGNYATLKVVREFREDLSLTEIENKELNVQLKDGAYTWDVKAVKPHYVEMSEMRTKMVVDALKKLDSENQLSEEFLPLYERFIK